MAFEKHDWLVTNGLGGYAFGQVAGPPTRGYHAPLVAAHAPPRGREIAVQHLFDEATAGSQTVALSPMDDAGAPDALEDFSLEAGLPVWRFRVGAGRLEKRLAMVHGENTTVLGYRNIGRLELSLRLEPWLNVRGHNQPLDEPGPSLQWRAREDTLRISRAGAEDLVLRAIGGRAARLPARTVALFRSLEQVRGYASTGPVQNGGALQLQLAPGEQGALVMSTEPDAAERRGSQSIAAELSRRRALANKSDQPVSLLRIAADAFVTRRCSDGAPTLTAGYPWFTDWGRDTFISLEGLALCTGRFELAREILLGFAAHLHDGLIPNHFPDGPGEPLYNTADATLWFIHALGRYVAHSGDAALVELLKPKLREIIDRHLGGTRYGIGVDRDGLLRQGAPDLQLTWMDAKIGDQVVTPRRGKAVELNALWFQALSLCAAWLGDAALQAEAGRVQKCFNARFWCEAAGHLYDVIDGEAGDDAAQRPNQLFALSLPRPVLARERWPAVLASADRELLTPFGLRTLSPRHGDYRGTYAGELRARDLAYHQGTVWPWLLGAWADAKLALDPNAKPEVRRALGPLLRYLDEHGQVAEVFSGDAPHAPEGCVAQAWSVAELLRAFMKVTE